MIFYGINYGDPKEQERTFTLDCKINVIKCSDFFRIKKCLNKQHINIHSLIQRFDVDILDTAIFSAFECEI